MNARALLLALVALAPVGCFLADYSKEGEATSASSSSSSGGGSTATGSATSAGGATSTSNAASSGSPSSSATSTSTSSSGSAGAGGVMNVCAPAAAVPANDPCANKPGPAMVHVPKKDGGTYCVDATEVTNDDYAKFLATKPDAKSQPMHCAWNADLSPMGWSGVPSGKEKLPVVNVNWCDAAAYCAYAGKRLCGDTSGGHAKFDTSSADPDGDQWYRACSNAGQNVFPYDASAYGDHTCNGSDYGAGAPIDVAKDATCNGGFCGLFDMAGNVAEWIDACEGYTAQSESCFAVGGSFSDGGMNVSCLALATGTRDVVAPNLGFRCCLDAP